MSGDIDTDLPHNCDRLGMNVTRRPRAGALHVEEIAGSFPQNTLCDVTAAGVAGAKNENGWFLAHGSWTRV